VNPLGALALGVIGSLLAAGFSAAAPPAGPVEGTQGYRDEIGRPPDPYTGPPRSGAEVYAYRCAACHAKTTQGAPMPGDELEWGLRARQGMALLMAHTIEGYRRGLMPPRGGCGNCSDSELRAAVRYMLQQSGIAPPP